MQHSLDLNVNEGRLKMRERKMRHKIARLDDARNVTYVSSDVSL